MSKLREILLLKANFNTLNKLVFNSKLMLFLEDKEVIPYKIIGERRGYLAIYIALNKKLVSDMENQVKKLMVVISADASNCYDCIVYSFVSMACQHFGLSLEYILLLFGTIQTLKMFLRTSYRISSSYYTGLALQPFQRGVQGNGVAPPI